MADPLQAADSAQRKFHLAFVGTGFCLVENKYILTAHHVLNNGNNRLQEDRYYVFVVPENGPKAYHAAVAEFILEDKAADMAVFAIEPLAGGVTISAVPLTTACPADGARVLTYGFPSPAIGGAILDPAGRFTGGGQFFLKAHANEGIVSGQFDLDGAHFFEFNVGWHHGESGGPIFDPDTFAAFSLMQHYRNIQTPHGIHPGPHVGRAFNRLTGLLQSIGARMI